MSSNKSIHVTEELVSQVADILKLGKLKHFCGNELLIKCPYCRARTHSFFVNIDTGEYECLHCRMAGNFKDLDIELLGGVLVEPTNICNEFVVPNLPGCLLSFHFVDKDLDYVLSQSDFKPSLIFLRKDNYRDFEFVYYFSNLKELTAQYKVIALRLLSRFDKLRSERISDDEFEDNYVLFKANDLFYKVIDHYSDSQLNSLIALFGNRLNAD